MPQFNGLAKKTLGLSTEKAIATREISEEPNETRLRRKTTIYMCNIRKLCNTASNLGGAHTFGTIGHLRKPTQRSKLEPRGVGYILLGWVRDRPRETYNAMNLIVYDIVLPRAVTWHIDINKREPAAEKTIKETDEPTGPIVEEIHLDDSEGIGRGTST